MKLWRIIAVALGFLAARAAHADEPFVFGLPGIPPVFLAVQEYVAQEQGFFKKYGVAVQLRPFDTGVASARAAASGDIDFTVSPSAPIINIVSNAGVKLVGIYGLEHPDWVIGSTDPAVKSCKDLPGHPIGVDTPGGARSIALRQMTVNCGYAFDTLQQVGLGVNTAGALIAGQIAVGVLHLDDLVVIEQQLKRKLGIVLRIADVKPLSHYNLFAARAEKIAARRDTYVRVLAALIDAENFMHDPKNADRVAQVAAISGHTPEESKAALKEYIAIEFWPHGNDGLHEKNLAAEIATQVKSGGIQPGKTPVSPDQLVDRTLWPDAMKLVRGTK